jgi:exodeoxyribonuclease VII large subunit
MADVPFTVDLDDAPPSKPGGAARGSAEPAVYTVSQLTRRIRQLLEGALPTVSVQGEIGNLKIAASGHVYFNLKDSQAQIRCVMFRAAAQSLRFAPEEGLLVVARGRLSVYEARGEYQVQVLALEPQGVGALQLAFEQLKRRLESEGLFDPARKRPLPFLPRRIGIVTSLQGAAIRDMLTVLERRFPGLPILIAPAAVQGTGAAAEIAAALAALNRVAEAQHLDVIIVGRGGGSAEDLWAFNEEAVARAIHASAVPVISAVGHEIDFTIADFVADVRAPTPSAAAEIAVPSRTELIAAVGSLKAQLTHRAAGAVSLGRERWSHLRARLGSPEAILRQTALRLDDLNERMAQGRAVVLRQSRERILYSRQRLLALRPDRTIAVYGAVAAQARRALAPALTRHLGRLRERLQGKMGLLDSVSPLAVLGRGYAIVQDGAGKPLRSVKGVEPGDDVSVRLRDGSLETEVREVHRTQTDPSGTP